MHVNDSLLQREQLNTKILHWLRRHNYAGDAQRLDSIYEAGG